MGLSYTEALDYLYSFTNFERMPQVPYGPDTYDLDGFRELLAELGEPHRDLPAIHIAGTKGKGSVAAMLTSIGQAAELRVGTFTSPHLVTPRERIALDGHPVDPEAFARAVDLVRSALGGLNRRRRYRTTFEIFTAAAFLLFRERKVDLAVVETGMGGRLDTTNVLTPLVTAITPISLDHTAALGDTVAAVAGEKAGILKPGVPAVMGPQCREARSVLIRRAREIGAPLEEAATAFPIRPLQWSRRGTRIRFAPPGEPPWEGKLSLLGEHQVANATVACAAWRATGLGPGPGRDRQILARGLEQARWPGRFQIVRRGGAGRPWLVVDGAHNPASAQVFRMTMERLFPGREVVLVAAISANKPVDRLLELMAPLSRELVAPEIPHARLLPADDLVRRARDWFPLVRRSPSMPEALRGLQEERRSHRTVIAVVGSLFTAGAALSFLEDLPPEGP